MNDPYTFDQNWGSQGNVKSVAVIGAGIAGTSVAHALLCRGVHVTLIDSASTPGSGASGNPIALLAPRLPRTSTPIGRLMSLAYRYAVAFYDDLEGQGAKVWSGARGAFAMARSADEDERQRRAVATFDLPEDLMRRIDHEEASRLTGVPVPTGGLWFASAGALRPAAITTALTSKATYMQANIASLEENSDSVHVIDQQGASTGRFDYVVVAAGVGVMHLMADQNWPLRANRGQLAYLAALTPSPQVPVSYGGYISPLVDLGEDQHGHVLGATYARRDELPGAEWEVVRETDTLEMIDNLQAHLPEISAGKAIGGRTSLRATIRDYMPLAGRVTGKVYVLGGLGSRGFLTAPILGGLIAAQIAGGALPLDEDIIQALDPNRFKKKN